MRRHDGNKKHKNDELALFIKNAVLIVCALAALTTVFLLKTAYDFRTADRFTREVTVNDIPLYGMTYTPAKKLVYESTQKYLGNVRIDCDARGVTFTLSGRDFMSTNLDETMERAISLGSDEQPDEKWFLYTDYFVDAKKIKSKLSDIAAATNSTPVEPTAEFDKNTETFTYKEGKAGYSLDIDKCVGMITSEIENESYEPVRLIYTEIKPQYTVSDLKANTVLLSKYVSVTTNNYNRNKNIELMCSYVNGYCIAPGDVLSINGLVGERTAEKGFLAAPAIMDGKKTVDDIGGGICQLSGTLYNAALRANMKIVERWPHSWPSDYVDIGLDSTLDWNTQKDLKIQNTSDFNMYIAAHLVNSDLSGANRLYVAIYGQSFPDGVTIDVVSEITEVTAPEKTAITYTSSLAPGQTRQLIKSRLGYKTRVWRYFYCNGVLLDSEIVGTSTYLPIRGEVLVGKGTQGYKPPTATPTPTGEPTPAPPGPQPTPPDGEGG